MNTPSPRPPVARQLLSLAAPIIGLNVLNVLALAVDTAMVGRLPDAEAALTGLGFATQLIFLLMVAMMGLTVGTVATVARAHGARQPDRVQHVLLQSTQLTILLGLAVAVLGNGVAAPLMRALGAEGDALEQGLLYLRVMLLGSGFAYLNILYAGVLRSVGDARLPFRISLASNALNVLLNYGLILGNYGLPALGVQGAAIGTVASQAFAVTAMIGLLRRGALPGLSPTLRPAPIDGALARSLIRVGSPAALDMLVINASFLSIVGMLGRLDPLAVAAHGVGLRFQALAFVPGMSVSQATAAMVGNALGAGEPERAREIIRASVKLCLVIMTVLALGIMAGAYPLVALFDVQRGTPLAELSVTWMRVLGTGMPLAGFYIAFVGALQGAGATRISLRVNLLSTALLQIPLSLALGFPLGLGPLGVWAGFPLSYLGKCSMVYRAYRRERWDQTGASV